MKKVKIWQMDNEDPTSLEVADNVATIICGQFANKHNLSFMDNDKDQWLFNHDHIVAIRIVEKKSEPNS